MTLPFFFRGFIHAYDFSRHSFTRWSSSVLLFRLAIIAGRSYRPALLVVTDKRNGFYMGATVGSSRVRIDFFGWSPQREVLVNLEDIGLVLIRELGLDYGISTTWNAIRGLCHLMGDWPSLRYGPLLLLSGSYKPSLL